MQIILNIDQRTLELVGIKRDLLTSLQSERSASGDVHRACRQYDSVCLQLQTALGMVALGLIEDQLTMPSSVIAALTHTGGNAEGRIAAGAND